MSESILYNINCYNAFIEDTFNIMKLLNFMLPGTEMDSFYVKIII